MSAGERSEAGLPVRAYYRGPVARGNPPELTVSVVRTLGVVRGVTVRARWIGSQITASLRTLGGGQIPEYIELCKQTRAEAFA